VQCIHPGWSRLTGWRAVRDSWIRIFNHTRSMTFQITDPQVSVEGSVAWVVCIERITMLVDEEPQETQVLATNMFVRPGHQHDPSEERQWLMVHHHGSPVLQRVVEPEDQADQ
jgi:ketosteroid isomerase-like protein